MSEYVTRKEVLKVLKVHYQTLYRMIDRKEIETITVGKQTMPLNSATIYLFHPIVIKI